MKNIIVFSFFVFTSSVFAQISPTPVANNEVRDNNSIRMRSVELERAKREANKSFSNESNEETAIRFANIKVDFENIQKLQAEIIKAYTAEKEINYQKISESATEIHKKSKRLEANLFNTTPKVEKKDKEKKQLGIKDLIIELDTAIGSFVDSPIFKSNNLIEKKDAEESQANLENIIKLSRKLAQLSNQRLS